MQSAQYILGAFGTDCDLKRFGLAMATHGRSGLRRLLLGSVAEQVLRHAHMPVLLYPPATGRT